MEGSIRSAKYQAGQLGYEGQFVPARKTKALGRGKGGLAILSRLGTPMLRATTSAQADLGRGYATRALILEVAPCAAELAGSRLLVGGDWNLEPEEFPMYLAQGSGLHRPLARPGASAPQGTRRLDWFLASTNLLPSVGWEEVTGYKPDHYAV
eukprot:2814573-Amphidinium_carterae.2